MLPRRTPFSIVEEFELVHAWLFASQGDVELQQRALGRISVWMARGTCPQAIEATADLVDVLLQAAQGRYSQHSARLAYATAITRFVNGLVDPVQQGYYARSIGSIASQLGLPQYFVELRHAATHENLPGLAILHDACRRALDWLYERYWLPSIESSGTQQSLVHQHLNEELGKLFKAYKAQRKHAIRDATKEDAEGQAKLLMAIEKLAAGLGMQYGVSEGLDAVAEHLVSPGGLVPKGKAKRADGLARLALPAELVSIWTPLLDHIDEAFDGFQQILLLRILDVLCFSPDEDDELTSLSDASTSPSQTLAAWLLHLLPRSNNLEDSRELVVRLCLLHPNNTTLSLLESLSVQVDSIKQLLPLAKTQRSNGVAPPTPENLDAQLDSMEARLRQLEERSAGPVTTQKMAVDGDVRANAAWQHLDASTWRPCPIGCLVDGRVPDLDYRPL